MQGKNKFALYVFLVIICSAVGLRTVNFFTKQGKVIIKDQTFKVAVLKDEWELRQGLSGKEKLAKNKGMLFVFPKEDKYSFWMKDMRFSIDIIWINNDKIIHIEENLPIPTTNYLEEYSPEEPARYVLEINAGLSQKYGFKVGDTVKLDI